MPNFDKCLSNTTQIKQSIAEPTPYKEAPKFPDLMHLNNGKFVVLNKRSGCQLVLQLVW